jgi:hypothetical protein
MNSLSRASRSWWTAPCAPPVTLADVASVANRSIESMPHLSFTPLDLGPGYKNPAPPMGQPEAVNRRGQVAIRPIPFAGHLGNQHRRWITTQFRRGRSRERLLVCSGWIGFARTF